MRSGKTLFSYLISITGLKYMSILPAVFLFLSCDLEESVNPSNLTNIRINLSLSSLDRNIFLFDLISLNNEGFLAVGVCDNNQMNSKFEGDGSLYVMKLDVEGNFEWDSCYIREDRGFPSNMIRKSDQEFMVVWNSFDTSKDLEIIGIQLNPSVSFNSQFIQGLSDAGEVFDVIPGFLSGYILLGLKEDEIQNNFVNVVEVNNDFSFNRVLTQRYFIPQKLGGFGLNDIPFLQRVSNYLKILKNYGADESSNRLVFTGPQDSLMTFSHVGEIIPSYSDRRFWISYTINSGQSNEAYAAIISDVETTGGRSYFHQTLNLIGPPENIGPDDLIKNSIILDFINPDNRMVIIELSGLSGSYLVGGSTRAGQVRLFLINNQQKKSSSLGTQIPMEFVDMAEMRNGRVLIIGHTILANELQKPFVLFSDPTRF